MPQLGDGPAHSGEHGEAGVLDLRLSHPVESIPGAGESKGVKTNIPGEGSVEGGRGLDIEGNPLHLSPLSRHGDGGGSWGGGHGA